MRLSQYYFNSYKEIPAEAELISHKLMLRAGMIRKLGTGLYTWLPIGLRILRKIENIVREEMDRAGAIEMLMPNIQPSTLWKETKRWEDFGPLLLKMQDQKHREYCFGPTHEEVITDIVRNEINSYKKLPVMLYQIQTKFRDEIRPRFGVMRAREFLMKDAYSFSIDQTGMQKSYDIMYEAYTRIFDRCGLTFRAVSADSGSIGGNVSCEFHVLSDSGEDTILFSDSSDYAANQEQAECLSSKKPRTTMNMTLQKISTPNIKTIEALAEMLEVEEKKTIKILIVRGEHTPYVALALRGDHQLNLIKAAKHPDIKSPLSFVREDEIKSELNLSVGSIGPINLNIPIIADRSTHDLVDFICGANQEDFHYIGVNWARDCESPEFADLRQALPGDPSPDGLGTLKMCKGIEVGHIFQLGDKYSKSMNATALDQSGNRQYLQMGCYGIGVSRIVAATIEQHHDDKGILWPLSIAPFQIALISINADKVPQLKEKAEDIYQELLSLGYEVLLDDRNERLGVKMSDMDLIGIPHRLLIGEKGLNNSYVEYKSRHGNGGSGRDISLKSLAAILPEIIS